MAIVEIVNKSTGMKSVLFRNPERTLKHGVHNEMDDVYLVRTEKYTFAEHPWVPWARSEKEFKNNHHLVLQVGGVVHYIWEHAGHIRHSYSGWKKPTEGNRIGGHSASSGNHKLTVTDRYVTAEKADATEVASAQTRASQACWIQFYGSLNGRQWCGVNHRATPPELFFTKAREAAMKLVPVDENDARHGFLLESHHEGVDWWLSAAVINGGDPTADPAQGPRLGFTQDRAEALQVNPLIRNGKVLFRQSPRQGPGVLTLDTRGYRATLEPFDGTNEVPIIQWFGFEMEPIEELPPVYVFNVGNHAVLTAAGTEDGALVEARPRSEADPDKQRWSLRRAEGGDHLVNVAADLFLGAREVGGQERLCISHRANSAARIWEPHGEGVMRCVRSNQVVTLGKAGENGTELFLRERQEPLPPQQCWIVGASQASE